jgi:hypothetical protein
MEKCLVIFAAALAAASPIYAQDAVQGSETGFYVRTSGGTPSICGFEFTIAYLDRTYLNGRLAGVTGSLNWQESEGSIGVILKVVGRDFPNPTQTAMRPFPVPNAFISVDGSPLAPDMTIACEDRTSFCGVYGMIRSVQVFKALLSKPVSVSFARQARGLDVTLPLDVRSAVQASTKDFENFNACMGSLVERAQAKKK